MTKKDDDSGWGQHLSLGLQTMVGVMLGVLVGRWLDGKFHWEPWGTMVCSMLGLAAGMYLLIKEGMRANK